MAATPFAPLESRLRREIRGEVLFVAGGQQNYGRNQALFDRQLGKKEGD